MAEPAGRDIRYDRRRRHRHPITIVIVIVIVQGPSTQDRAEESSRPVIPSHPPTTSSVVATVFAASGRGVHDALGAWGKAAAVLVGSLVLVEVVFGVACFVARRTSHPRLPLLAARSKHAVQALAISVAGASVVRLAPESARGALGEVARVAVIFSVAWIAISAAGILTDLVEGRFDVGVVDNRRARRAVTQLALIRRVVAVVVIVVAVLVTLVSLPQVRTLGASLLASAGLIGVIAGIAGQSTLGNLIAGLQVAFSDALRLDDVVVVEGEWGTIEELTLTNVVVKVWDQRRLVLPVSYFVQNPFENWTRTSSQLVGSVLLFVDYTTPLDELRRELDRILEESPMWDRRVSELQVVDATECTMQVRALVSAPTAGLTWDLRCAVREQLLAFLREHHPAALPRWRLEHASADAPGEVLDGPRLR